MDEERNIEPQILIDVSYKKCSKIDYVTSEAFELHGKEKNNNNKTIKSMMRNFIVMMFLLVISLPFYAQDRLTGQKGSVVGIKTNIPYWGTATFNAGAEFRLARHWSLDIETGLNPFDGKKDDGSYGKSLKHWRLHPEMRYWFCETFYKHFIGLHVPYLLYNVSDIRMFGLEGKRRQGDHK